MARGKAEEILELAQIHEENPNLTISMLQGAIRTKKLRATKLGRKYMVSRGDLNKYLGLENNDELMELQLENQRLKAKIDMYKSQFSTVKQLMETVNGVINVI